MALKKIQGRYTLTHAEGLGQGVGSIPTGTVVDVDEVVDSATAGVGGEVVFSLPIDGLDHEFEVRRRVAMARTDFERMFERAKDED